MNKHQVATGVLFFQGEMASKAVLLALACFLLIETRVSSKWAEEILLQVSPIYKSSPPPTSPVVTAPPTPSVTKAPTPPPLVPNAPPSPSPVAKTPPTPPPQVKETTSPPPVLVPNASPPPPPVAKTPPTHPPQVKAPTPPPPLAETPSPPVPKTPPPVKAPTPQLPYVKPPRTRQDCIPLCVVRCKNHSRKNVCMRACLTCCERCKCVPPGQYGNKEKCGKCYTNMTTRGGKLKCP